MPPKRLRKNKIEDQEPTQEENLSNSENEDHDENTHSKKRSRTGVTSSQPTTLALTKSKQNDQNDEELVREIQNELNSHSATLPTFRKGAIVRAKLHNFMTYDDCEFEPGPGLNLVLGPNGSGKSSIVSAICVGLHGKTNLLGRATKVGDYVKRGADDAFVEFELYNPDGDNFIIKRTFHRDRNSEWYYNGQVKPSDFIKKRIEDLNIQLENLTQFLPQEKVASFANLGPVELLKATQEAVLPPESVEYHTRLADMKKNVLKKSKEIEETQKLLETMKKKQETLQKEVETYEARKKHLTRVEELQMKLPFIQFVDCQKAAKEVKKDLDTQKQELQKFIEKIEPLKREIEDCKAKMEGGQEQYRKEWSDIDSQKAKLANHKKKLEDLATSSTKIIADISYLEDQEQEREKKKQATERAIRDAKEELQKIRPEETLLAEEQELSNKLIELDREYQKKQEDKGEIMQAVKAKERELDAKNVEISKLENVKTRRLGFFKEKYPEIFAIYDWVEKNKLRFEKDVYFLPLSISVSNDLHGNYLETQCPHWLLTAFVCESRKDRETLLKEYRGSQNSCTVIAREDDGGEDYQKHPCDIALVKKYGIYNFLDEVFDAPPVIKAVMKDNVAIHKTAIGTEETDFSVVMNDKQANIKALLTPRNQYIGRVSRYGNNELSTRVSAVKEAKILRGADLSKITQLKEQKDKIVAEVEKLRRELSIIDTDIRNILSDKERLKTKKSALERERRAINQWRQQIKQRERTLQELNKESNVEEEKKKLMKEFGNNSIARQDENEKYRKLLREILQKVVNADKFLLKKAHLQSELEKKEFEIQDAKAKEKELQKVVQRLEQAFLAKRTELQSLKSKAEAIRQAYATKHDKNQKEVDDILLSLPEDTEEIMRQIDEEEAAANAIYHNPAVVEQYERICSEIEQKEATLDENKKIFEDENTKINALETEWLNPLKECVRRIDITFQELCKNVGISGEVALNAHPTDYEKYEIQLRVRFRDGETMQILQSHRQSGGERALTTILYLLSLQHLNKCPFRVVDEINQGMDPVNERKVFHQMLKASQGDNIPQTFLITPKLLPNLVPNDARNITVLFIYNGKYNEKQKNWNRYFKEHQLVVDPNLN